MVTALVSGIVLGLSAGLAPGPMLALVLAQTFRHGPREGCKVALSPLVTDPPIILVTLFLANRLAELRPLLGLISIAGAIFVLYLAWESYRAVLSDATSVAEHPQSWVKGIVTNLLNPHPWIFWLTVGAAVLAKLMAQGWPAVAAFLVGFYVLLIGSKVLLALLTGKSRHWLAGRGYRVAMRVLAGLLAGFALLLFREGWRQMAGG